MMFSLTTLGVSSASPTTDRYPSAHILKICGRLFLIDCGEAAQMLMKRHHLSIFRLDGIFISHLHGDHVFGLFGLLSTLSMKKRERDLHIYAPEGIEEMLKFFDEHFEDGRLFRIICHRVDTDLCTEVLSDDELSVTAFPLLHRVPTAGYRFEEKKGRRRSFAYVSDTAVYDGLAEHVAGVDLLYHEATFGEELTEKAALMYHSTAAQAAGTAVSAGVSRLVIGHFSSRYDDLSGLLSQARSVFPNTFLAEEGMEFEV